MPRNASDPLKKAILQIKITFINLDDIVFHQLAPLNFHLNTVLD